MARKRLRKRPVDLRIAPTNEAYQHGEFEGAGLAYRRVPVIDTMHKRGQITEAEYRALAFYRDQAGIADSSPVKSCLDIRIPGGDTGAGYVINSALLTTARLERDMGSLWPIARAIAVDDRSLSQWCVDKFGGRERYNDKGEFVAVVPMGGKHSEAMALLELRMAARRVVP